MTVVYSKRLKAATFIQKLANWLLYELSQETLKGDFVCQKSNLNTTKISRNEKLTHQPLIQTHYSNSSAKSTAKLNFPFICWGQKSVLYYGLLKTLIFTTTHQIEAKNWRLYTRQ